MKKTIIYILCSLIAALLVVMAIWKFDNNDSSLKEITVAEVTHSVFYAPFYVALENGYFEEVGIDVKIMLVSGSDNVATSVLSGDTEIGLAGPESALFVYTGGEKDYPVTFAGLTKRDGQFIISHNKDFAWKDLIGKEILIGRSTGMPAMSFMRALKNEGIDKDKIKINTSVEFAELSGAYLSGTGDYVNLFEPLATTLETNKKGYVVSSVGLYSDEFPYTAFYTKKSYLKENKELLKDFTKAINKGLKYTLENDPEDIAKVIKPQFNDQKIEELTTITKRYQDADVWQKTPYISEEFYNTLLDLLKENKLLKETVYFEDLVNNLYE